jgi:hypothetical protein
MECNTHQRKWSAILNSPRQRTWRATGNPPRQRTWIIPPTPAPAKESGVQQVTPPPKKVEYLPPAKEAGVQQVNPTSKKRAVQQVPPPAKERQSHRHVCCSRTQQFHLEHSGMWVHRGQKSGQGVRARPGFHVLSDAALAIISTSEPKGIPSM